jgi:hypothetical protein
MIKEKVTFMPITLMLPNHLDELFTKARVSPEIARAINLKIHRLHEGPHFKKKFFGSKIVYSINVNIDGAHRLLFDLVENELGSVFVLRDIAFHHNYRKALKWRPLGNVSSNELFQLGYTISHQNVATDKDAIEELPSAILYKDDWLDLTDVQSEVLSQQTFPQLIVGPPGSGKTLVSLAFFQEQALRHQAEGHGLLKLLYIAEHPELTLEIESTWRNWAKHDLAQDKAHVQAIFLSFSELNKWYVEESHLKVTIIDTDSCLNKLKQLSKKRTSIEPSLILDELIHSAHLLNDDIKNGRRYSNSNYYTGGINQVTLSLSDKEIIYDLYHKLSVQLKKENVVFLGFLSIGDCPLGFEYDFICVDEAQNSSINNLFNALTMAKANHLIYCGDSYQRSKIKVSSLPLLEPELYKKEISLTKSCLPITHRLQPSVAHLCEHLILLGAVYISHR